MIELKQHPELPKNPVPILIIGAGGIVRDAHLPAYAMAGFPVMGIYDKDIGKAQAVQRRFPFIGKVYDTMEEVLSAIRNEKIVVDLAVPAGAIMEVLDKLPSKTPVLIQKPMGEDIAQARQILDLCQKKEFISAVNFQLRYAPYSIAARHLMERGKIGQVYDYEIKVCVYTPWHLWKFLYDLPRVEILYHSIHYIDLIRSFAGNPSKIFASTIKHPKMMELASTRTTIIMDYDKVTQARIICNHGHDFGKEHQESYLKIEGTEGAIKIRIGVSLDYPKGEPPRFEYMLHSDRQGWRELPLEGGWFPHAFVGTMAGIQRYLSGESAVLEQNTSDAFETMKWVEKAYQSSEEGGVK